MKNILTFLLILLFTFSYGQVTYTTLPLDKQLVGRDVVTNKGDVIVEGEVNNVGVTYDAIEIELYRDGVLQNTFTQNLTFTGNTAPFNFAIEITAELINYSIKVYGKTGAVLTLEEEVFDLVAGDVYIIQGQSNAAAAMESYAGTNTSASAYEDQFIRVYSSGTAKKSVLDINNHWYIGDGDGNLTNGNTGQWGIKLANTLMNSEQIPIAIFNGAYPGQPIEYYLKDINLNPVFWFTKNYARLYHRLEITGLRDKVRGVFWAQGETDGDDGIPGGGPGQGSDTPQALYKSRLETLISFWLADYSNIEHIYIFQTRNGCEGELFGIKEAQRQVAFEDSNISIMPTQAIISDNCHYPFINGYETFADRIFPLVDRDIYGATYANEIDAPMIQSATLINSTTLEVVTDATTLSIATVTLPEFFRLENASQVDISNTITNLAVAGNKIIFTLSTDPGVNATISYLGQIQGSVPGNFVINSNGLEILCFYRYPVVIGVLEVDDENLKNNFTIVSKENNLLIKSDTPIEQIKIYDVMGKLLIDKKQKEKEFRIDTNNIRKGTVLIVNTTFENGAEISKKAIKY